VATATEMWDCGCSVVDDIAKKQRPSKAICIALLKAAIILWAADFIKK
jgi:hypothetical protein